MDDEFSFGFTSGPREPDYDRRPYATEARGNFHRRRQGFSEPYDTSPFENPPGWYGGAVRQTGGMVMVREWSTTPNYELYRSNQKARDVEYEVAYGDNAGVSINRYVWRDEHYTSDQGGYAWDGVVEERTVRSNTDQAKARVALELMRKHSDKTR